MTKLNTRPARARLCAMMLVPIYRSAVHQFDVRVRAVRPEQWSASTPDDDWDVHRLVRHVILGQRLVPQTLDGTDTEPSIPWAEEAGGDLVNDWADASATAVEAVTALDSWERPVTLPVGELPAQEYLWRLATDLTVHAWDLARAIGADDNFPNDLLGAVLDQLKEFADGWLTAGQYAPSIPVPGCTDDLTELLALTGRNRWWRRS
ncbi:MAG TPA: TIGR03086 family metal-binding protein [Nakamurella sp.]